MLFQNPSTMRSLQYILFIPYSVLSLLYTTFRSLCPLKNVFCKDGLSKKMYYHDDERRRWSCFFKQRWQSFSTIFKCLYFLSLALWYFPHLRRQSWRFCNNWFQPSIILVWHLFSKAPRSISFTLQCINQPLNLMYLRIVKWDALDYKFTWHAFIKMLLL